MNCLSSCERESNLFSFIRLCFMAAGMGGIALNGEDQFSFVSKLG